MAAMPYWQQLRHPLWQRKRLEVFQRDGFMCMSCLCVDKTLHAHHKRYVKGRMAWEYPLEELQTLCDDCHEKEHEQLVEFQGAVAVSGMTLPDLTALVRGYSAAGGAFYCPPGEIQSLEFKEACARVARACEVLSFGDIEKVIAFARQLFELDAFGEIRTK